MNNLWLKVCSGIWKAGWCPVSPRCYDQHLGLNLATFLAKEGNSVLYKAQLYRYAKTGRKPIRWEAIYNTKVNALLKINMNSFAHSKVKGFMWLFYTHALPVGARMRGKEANTPCGICGGRETIDHMAHHCPTAKLTWRLVAKEWFARTGQEEWLTNHSFAKTFFDVEHVSGMWPEMRILRDITLHNIWKNRCEVKYREASSLPPAIIANKAFIDFESALRARLQSLRSEEKWWTFRDAAARVSPEAHAQALERISTESTKISAILPVWARPTKYKLVALALERSWRQAYATRQEEGIALPPLPCVFPARVNHLWRLSTCPRSGGKVLQTPLWSPKREPQEQEALL